MVWEGQSLFDHVGWKMGYCFTAENVKGKVSRELQLTLTIRNHGFGMLYDDADIWIFVRGEEPSAELLRLGKLEGNLCGIPSGNDAEFQGHFPIKSLLETNGDQAIWLYAKMLRRRDGKMIPFEQESMDGCLPLGVLR